MTKKNEPDFIVIGAGLSGLLIAYGLKKMGWRVSILETNHHIGGFNRGIGSPLGVFNNGLRLFSDQEETRHALAFLSDLLDMKIELYPQSETVVTFEGGQFKPFVGFGDSAPPFADELNYFIHENSLKIYPEVFQWTKILAERMSEDIETRMLVTKLLSDGKKILNCKVNSSKELKAKHFIFTGPPKDLLGLLSSDDINSRTKQRLAKNQYWTALCLDLLHVKPVSHSTGIHVLNGTTQDEIGPCVGLFHKTKDGDAKQLSQWVSFIDQDDADDEENIGIALKKIKKQIKRAYPDALESLISERIVVVPYYAGAGGLNLKDVPLWPGLENFWLGSPQFNSSKNIIGCLKQAEFVLKNIQEQTPHEVPEADSEKFEDEPSH